MICQAASRHGVPVWSMVRTRSPCCHWISNNSAATTTPPVATSGSGPPFRQRVPVGPPPTPAPHSSGHHQLGWQRQRTGPFPGKTSSPGGGPGPACWLAFPEAIAFWKTTGPKRFRDQSHDLVNQARRRVLELTGLEAPTPESQRWYGPMTIFPLPPQTPAETGHGHIDPLQRTLQQEFGKRDPGDDNARAPLHPHLVPPLQHRPDIDHLVNSLSECL
ncbi:MAG: hypothetical protein Ct9H300mP1_20710 [Planctomycetaceae bacterium]|nr:MAG: hypothetical protein Ct9H300mP1_20710 [Planctomycetaceae bacterium]